jgi:hypothetical protein
MMRNSLSFQRRVRPTLLAPPKSLSFVSALRTIRGSGPVSARESQPRPYRNGTSNMAKKSPVVTRVTAFIGTMGPFGP